MTGPVALVVTNEGTGRTRPIELLEARHPDLSAGTHCLIPALAGGRSAVAHYPLLARRRGRFVLGPAAGPAGRPVRHLGGQPDPAGAQRGSGRADRRSPAGQSRPAAGSLSAPSGRAALGTHRRRPGRRGPAVPAWRRHPHRALASHRPARRPDGAAHRAGLPRRRHRPARSPSGCARGHRCRLEPGGGGQPGGLGDPAPARERFITSGWSRRVARQLAGGHDIADDVLATLALIEGDPSALVDPAAVASNGLLVAVLGRLDERSTSLFDRRPTAVRGRGGAAARHRRLGRRPAGPRPRPGTDCGGLARRARRSGRRPRRGVAPGVLAR